MSLNWNVGRSMHRRYKDKIEYISISRYVSLRTGRCYRSMRVLLMLEEEYVTRAVFKIN